MYRNNGIKVKPGIEVLLEKKLDLLAGKKVGLITNPTGVTSNLMSTIDVLAERPELTLIALFGPEHGIRGNVWAGKKVKDFRDPKTGIKVYSLYGKVLKPTRRMLKKVDLLIFDIQDIGIRPYTYIYTMAYAMEASAEAEIPFIVLDRPNPLGGELVEGPVLDLRFKSFIGLYPIPYIHGMTVGELAKLFNEEFGINCDLKVVPMEGWERRMNFGDTGLPWVPPSPHVSHWQTVFYIAATGGIGELGTLSEGVGTPQPFELIGAPWIDPEILAAELNAKNLPGVLFRPTYYKSFYFRFTEEPVPGVQLHIQNFRTFQPFTTQIHLLCALAKLYPHLPFLEKLEGTEGKHGFYRAVGTDQVEKDLRAGKSAPEIIDSWEDGLQRYMKIREKYLMYK